MSLPDVFDRDTLQELLTPLDVVVAGPPRPIGDDFGFASVRVAVPVQGPGGEQIDVVVKIWSATEFGLDEVEFYEEWAPRLSIRLPSLIGAAAHDDLGLLVLQKVEVARQGDFEVPLEASDAAMLAQDLARVHVTTCDGDPGDLGRRGLPRPSDWHDSRRVAFADRFGLPDSEPLRTIVVHSEQAESLAASLMGASPQSLVHADIHQDNVVVDETGRPILLDWARFGWGQSVHDLAALLLCVDTATRDTVIGAYRSVSPVSDDQLHGAELHRLVTATLGAARWMPTSERQQRTLDLGLLKAQESAGSLAATRPDIFDQLTG